MRIGIDGTCWPSRRGYGRFVREIVEALGRQGSGHEFVVFLDSMEHGQFQPSGTMRTIVVRTSKPATKAARPKSRRTVPDLVRMARAVVREKLDLLFFPMVYSYFPVWKRHPIVVAIHDIIPESHPGPAFATRWNERLWHVKRRLAVAQADRIVTISEYSRRGLSKLLRMPERRIHVVYLAASRQFRRLDIARDQPPFFLTVGGLNPHKNLATLVRAFGKLHPGHTGLRLVLAGAYNPDSAWGRDLRGLVSSLGLNEAVSFTGYVPDPALCELYNRAAMLVFPSLDEGFGLPALEAMACGCPVIVSSGNALEEVAGGAAVVVNACGEEDLRAAMERVLCDADLAADLSARGLRRAAEFSWDASARRLIEIFEETKQTWRN